MTPAIVLWMAGCHAPPPVRIGSKEFAENRILAEVVARLLQDAGIGIERHLGTGDTHACQSALQRGEIDVYPEYTGTALAALGLPSERNGDRAWRSLVDHTEGLDQVWSVRFGFDNPYVLVTTPGVAARHSLSRIGDLVGVDVGWRVAAAPEFLQRPIDGFQALGRHYGIAEWEATILDARPAVLHGALLSGRVDLVVADATDPWIDEFGLQILDDDLGFFPAYEAAPVLSRSIAEDRPELQEILEPLQDTIDQEAMRIANRAVSVDGLDPRLAAEGLLVEAGLATPSPVPEIQRIAVAVLPGGEAPRLAGLALKAVREVHPGMRVVTEVLPGADLHAAPIAVVPAPMLFGAPRPNGRAKPRTDLHAIAALGHTTVHWIVAADAPKLWSAATRVGVGATGSGADRIATLLESAYGLDLERVHGDTADQLADLDRGVLDAVVLLDEVGGAIPTLALRSPSRKVVGIEGWVESDRGFRLPFLRAQRLPPGTYPGQDDPLPTLGTQVVLVAPTVTGIPLGGGGPAAALLTTTGLSEDRQSAIAAALDFLPLDPALPEQQTRAVAQVGLPMQPRVTVVNLATFVYLGWLVWVLAGGMRRRIE